MVKKNIRVFVDGEVLVLDHFSGIGHYTAALLKEVDHLISRPEYSHVKIEVGLPSSLAKNIHRFGYKNFTYRKMRTTPGIVNGLKRHGLIPPIDLFFGKRVYVFPHFSSWPTLYSPQIPIIYDLSFVHFPQYAAKKNQTFLVSQTKKSVGRAERIVTISQNSKREIAECYDYPSEHIDIITPILDTTRFKRQGKRLVNEVLAKYGIFDDFILFVGNIEPRKNLITLLKAYRELDPSLQKKYALLLVGAKGWRDSEIHNLIKEMREEGLKIIQPFGYVEDADLPALYSAARVFAYISVYEGYGIPPTEAMACGTPVVCSNNSSLPEAVEDGALMVDSMNVKQVVSALEKLLPESRFRDSLIKKGYERVQRLQPLESAGTFLECIINSIERKS